MIVYDLSPLKLQTSIKPVLTLITTDVAVTDFA